MEEITKQTAMNAYNKNFSKGKNTINDNFLMAYKANKLYTIIFKFKDKIGVLLFGTDQGLNKQHIFLDSSTFKYLKQIKVEAAEILFKGDKS